MKWYVACAALVIAVGGYFLFAQKINNGIAITNFEECAQVGNPIMESYPRQCRTADGKTFAEEIGNILEKADLIRLDSPQPNEAIGSPLIVRGSARGNWFFEASFPLILTDWDGKIIAESFAQAKSDPATGEVNWMTSEFVPFEGTLIFETPSYGERGALILKKDNPSGLPENDDALEVPIMFKNTTSQSQESNGGAALSQAVLETNFGNITLAFFPERTPKTVENFLTLAKSGFYDGTKFHRVIKGFMVQGGDPLSKDDTMKARWGTGGPGYQFADEIDTANKNDMGTIAMANSGPNTNGSQFFINVADNNFLDAKHTVFGKVVSGMDVVRQIENLPTDSTDKPISSAVITRITIK
ncbi:MAG: peptidylprolyl isomerase [Parcubacteria group bacterium]|nr:peptidylprolyl isomerase [Parcubacteria group bacterium]